MASFLTRIVGTRFGTRESILRRSRTFRSGDWNEKISHDDGWCATYVDAVLNAEIRFLELPRTCFHVA